MNLLEPEHLLLIHLAAAALFLLLIILCGVFLKKSIKRKKARRHQRKVAIEAEEQAIAARQQANNAMQQVQDAKRRVELLETELDRLSPFADMPDAFSELERSRKELNAFRKDSHKLVKEKMEESNLVLKQARARADSVLETANAQAHEIAGEAWEAKGRYEFYRKTVVAMQNKIEGYGDEYLIPNETLLDDMAVEYDYDEAGRQLKIIRNQIKSMIKDGKAADCDYKEVTRRQRSIEFALDAFNGKAETILAKVKKDNYGVMKKKLEDAEQLVNFNGIAFKNARILPRYAGLYQAQLKYAIQVKELKQRDRDEQRRIKAEMREEERVQRELKKAQQQAEKEQKAIMKAVKEAKAKLAISADVERGLFQTQLNELMGKLYEAEAKNQRAMSMAQQTRQGHVYIISNIGSFGENVIKIGMTRRLEPLDRIKELSDASVPFNFDVHAIVFSEDAPELERYLHSKLNNKRVNKVNHRKQFFNAVLGEVRAEIETMNLKCHWTMKAEALEYRESKQLSKVLTSADLQPDLALEVS